MNEHAKNCNFVQCTVEYSQSYQTCELQLYNCVQDGSVMSHVQNIKMNFVSHYHVNKTTGCIIC